MRTLPSYRVLGLLAVTLALGGCASDMSDLQQFVAAEKAKKPGPSQPLPQLKPYETVISQADSLRPPFMPDTESAAPAWFEASQRRFRRRHYGRAFALLLELLHRLPRRVEELDLPAINDVPADRLERAVWLEVSASPAGFPAAGHRLAPGVPIPRELPAEIWRRLAPGRYFLRLVDTDGADLALESIERP